jgi:arginine repressor
MDRVTLKRHLTKVEEQVAIITQNVARQRELVAELERDGYDASQAKKMLEQFLEQQALHIADRDRLMEELSEPPSL